MRSMYLTNEALNTVTEKIMDACSENKVLNEYEILFIVKGVKDDFNDRNNLYDIMERQGVKYIEDFLIDHR